MTRYYGLYAHHREMDKKLHKAIPKSKHHILQSFAKWRNNILLSFGYDSLSCPKCGHQMMFAEVYYAHHRVSLQDLYERIMVKAKCRSA